MIILLSIIINGLLIVVKNYRPRVRARMLALFRFELTNLRLGD